MYDLTHFGLDGSDQSGNHPGALQTIAVLDFSVWILVARAKRLVGRPESEWEGAYKRAVEGEPRRADILWEWSEGITRALRLIRLLRNGRRRARSATIGASRARARNVMAF